MRKIIFLSIILSLALPGCFHKKPTQVNDAPEAVNEQADAGSGKLAENQEREEEEKSEEQKFEKENNVVMQDNSVKQIKVANIYDKAIEEFLTNGYFDNITNPKIISCAQNIKDEVKSTELKMSIKGGRNVNGVNYDKKNNCIRFNKDCEEEVLNAEEKQIQEVISANRFNVVNGCLYDGQNKALNYSLFAYTHTDYFGKKIERIGEDADEWFRFENDNNLYIYLKGGAGCGGCIFNGPYLVINLNSGLIESRTADLPYLLYLVLSPNKNVAVEATWDENNNTELYLFDFVTSKRGQLIYEVPEDKSILVQGHGVSLVEGAITWIDNFTVGIQLFEKNDVDSYVKSEYIDNVGFEYFKSGEPTIIKIN